MLAQKCAICHIKILWRQTKMVVDVVTVVSRRQRLGTVAQHGLGKKVGHASHQRQAMGKWSHLTKGWRQPQGRAVVMASDRSSNIR